MPKTSETTSAAFKDNQITYIHIEETYRDAGEKSNSA
jgi:hypothetical protein